MRLINADALILKQLQKFEQKPSPRAWDRFVDIRDAIKSAPTIEPATNWTPCAEGLPENDPDHWAGRQLEATVEFREGHRTTMSAVRYWHPQDEKWYWSDAWRTVSVDDIDVRVPDKNVLAWRLPQPWTGEKKGGNE